MVNWHLSKQGIHLPVSQDRITGSSLELIKGIFLLLLFLFLCSFLWIRLHTTLIYHNTLTQFTTMIQLQITTQITIYNGNKTTYTTQQYDAIIDSTILQFAEITL